MVKSLDTCTADNPSQIAECFTKAFSSVFTKADGNNAALDQPLTASCSPQKRPITVTTRGVTKLLENLNPAKALDLMGSHLEFVFRQADVCFGVFVSGHCALVNESMSKTPSCKRAMVSGPTVALSLVFVFCNGIQLSFAFGIYNPFQIVHTAITDLQCVFVEYLVELVVGREAVCSQF